MNTHLSVSIFFIIAIAIIIPPSLCHDDDELYSVCSRPLECGGKIFPDAKYPFWGFPKHDYCGLQGLELKCQKEDLVLEIKTHRFKVLKVNTSARTITVAYEGRWDDVCAEIFPFVVVNTASTVAPAMTSINSSLKCSADQTNILLMYDTKEDVCPRCEESGGVCGSKSSSGEFQCFCHDGPHESACKKKGGLNWERKIAIAVVATFVGVAAACAGCYLYQRRKKNRYTMSSVLLSRNVSSETTSGNLDIEKGKGLGGVHLFTYEELQEATNNFDPSKELGDGGFGTVYYGKLHDGRTVAVKRLYENNYRCVEQFLNEIEILTGLVHPNLVSLYGCTSRTSRELLLVYEYIPNGTLADHLHGQRAKPGSLPWPIRLKITIETACALRYLHASDVVHRDVKTNNILLDQNFCVKVADFGLSRLFPKGKTHVSTCPQGTPGYVDPEYHQCYQLTNKSDVYSFGVVLVELISSMPAVDITRHRHEINLSNMAINKIQNHALREIVDPMLGFDTDPKVRQTVAAVAELAFHCLQAEKDLRPSMQEVLDTLVRIESHGYGPGKADEIDIGGGPDEAVLMKSGPLAAEESPDTVIVKWRSN